jgi:anti-sigma regulatory factor (Ser/Thr protein kinase)
MSGDPRRPQPPGPAAPVGAAPPGGRAARPAAGVPLILDQPFDRDSLYALRAAMAAHATAAGMSPARVHDLVMAVHELATNAVRHGAGHGQLRVWANRGAVHCEVSDDGAAPPPSAGPAPLDRLDGPWPGEHGHGLWLVRQVADQASLRSGPGGTVATVSFTLPEGAA